MPSACAIIIALVFGPIAASSWVPIASYVPISTSTTTGFKPFWIIGFTVVGKPIATVTTSSPALSALGPSFGLVRAESATRFALLPLFTNLEPLAPMYFASSLSNSSVYLPAVSQPSSDESTNATKSSGSRTFPETGTFDSPGLKADNWSLASANFRTLSKISIRSESRLESVTFPTFPALHNDPKIA